MTIYMCYCVCVQRMADVCARCSCPIPYDNHCLQYTQQLKKDTFIQKGLKKAKETLMEKFTDSGRKWGVNVNTSYIKVKQALEKAGVHVNTEDYNLSHMIVEVYNMVENKFNPLGRRDELYDYFWNIVDTKSQQEEIVISTMAEFMHAVVLRVFPEQDKRVLVIDTIIRSIRNRVEYRNGTKK